MKQILEFGSIRVTVIFAALLKPWQNQRSSKCQEKATGCLI